MSDFYVKRTAVEIADELVSIVKVCNWSGINVPEGFMSKSWKSYCPLARRWHLDGGLEKSLRVYADTNSAWCFGGCGRFTPSDMHARYLGISRLEAARDLLDRVGYRPPTLEERWSKASTAEVQVESSSLSLALMTFCERMSGSAWKHCQFQEAIAFKLDQCLALLDLVGTTEEAEKWLVASKSAMERVLHEYIGISRQPSA